MSGGSYIVLTSDGLLVNVNLIRKVTNNLDFKSSHSVFEFFRIFKGCSVRITLSSVMPFLDFVGLTHLFL